MLKITVVDGQGGGLGKNIVEQIKAQVKDCHVTCVGTNALATGAMLRAGADAGATGENAIAYNCSQCDVVAGPIGLIAENSLHGEISAFIAHAVASAPAIKLLIPSKKCNTRVMGTKEQSLNQYIEELVATLQEMTRPL